MSANGEMVRKRSVIVHGHKTSVSLEEAFWRALKSIAEREAMPVTELLSRIDIERKTGNLSSAIRLYVLAYFQDPQRTSPELGGPSPRPSMIHRR